MARMLALGNARESIDNTPENLNQDGRSLISFICDSLAVLWKDWPQAMQCNVLNLNANTFSLSGICPHCESNSVFIAVTSTYMETMPEGWTLFCAGMQCQGCKKFILGIVSRVPNVDALRYVTHFPLGNPNDSVDKDVPSEIAADFSEALRCFWVEAYKATVAMCRRSVQASCDALGAKGKNLKDQIDDLAAKQIITDPLRRMAHKVRLTANRELHAQTDDLETFKKPEAAAIIKVTREYFHHVYVMPALLNDSDEPEPQDSYQPPTH